MSDKLPASYYITDIKKPVKPLTDEEVWGEPSRPEPKFRVGQIVVMNSLRKQLPFRIQGVTWEVDGWFYQWDKNNWASEGMLRALTPEEIG